MAPVRMVWCNDKCKLLEERTWSVVTG